MIAGAHIHQTAKERAALVRSVHIVFLIRDRTIPHNTRSASAEQRKQQHKATSDGALVLYVVTLYYITYNEKNAR